jgi:hypothetical protein
MVLLMVGLMCLKVFVSGQDNKYEELKVKPCAWDLLFKSKFLRDLKDDNLLLNRNYFPGVDLKSLMKSQNSNHQRNRRRL